MKSRGEQLTWAKQRALICVDMGHFSDAVAGLRADLAENPLTNGVVSSDQARHGYKTAIDAAPGFASADRVDRGPQVTPARKWASVIAAPLVGFGWRRGLRERRWRWGCLELSQRRAQRIEAWCVRVSVVFDGAPDCRRYRGKLVVGEVNYRHGPDILG